jgi:hypothetical protein
MLGAGVFVVSMATVVVFGVATAVGSAVPGRDRQANKMNNKIEKQKSCRAGYFMIPVFL